MATSFADLQTSWRSGNTRLQRRWRGWQWRRKNAALLGASTGDELKLVFLIPLISRKKADDWAQIEKNLFATITSLRRQSDARWVAWVCCQDQPDSVSFDDQVRFLRFPHETKGYDNHPKATLMRRTHFGQERGAGYLFHLDADDVLHPDFVSYVLSDHNRQGYFIDRGYMLDYAAMRLADLRPADADYPKATEFIRNCGSSSALYFDVSRGADFLSVIDRRGNHRKVVRNMADFGFEMAPVPFHAAIYVMNHGDNLRKKRGLIAGKMQHFDISPVSDPARVAEVKKAFGFEALFPGRT